MTSYLLNERGKAGPLVRIRNALREPLAEFVGVAIFVFFGAAADCQVVLSSNTAVTSSPRGDWLSLSVGWATGLAMAVWVSAGISGGHVNPAVTLALATYRGFPWRKVPIYIFAQVMGGLIGAALAYAQYFNAITIVEGGPKIRTRTTAGLFAAFPLDYLSHASCFFSEFMGTALLAFFIVATTDKRNAAPPIFMFPVVIFFILLGLSVVIGMQTSFSFNPARDFGPRLFLSMVGYGRELYDFRNQYWLWCTILAPICGALVSVGFYDLFLKAADIEDMTNLNHDISEESRGPSNPSSGQGHISSSEELKYTSAV